MCIRDRVSNYKTIISIYEFLKLDLKIEGKIRQIGKITYTLAYYKKEYVGKILDKYLHESPIHLARKEESAKNIIERQKRIEQNNKNEDMKREKDVYKRQPKNNPQKISHF